VFQTIAKESREDMSPYLKLSRPPYTLLSTASITPIHQGGPVVPDGLGKGGPVVGVGLDVTVGVGVENGGKVNEGIGAGNSREDSDTFVELDSD
jgi:hypothetical protein